MRTQITLLSFVACVSLAATAAQSEDEHRELGAHVHGHGTLNIAVEGNRVAMELEAPGMDIVGFEHEANSDEQKAAVEKAKAELAKPLELFKVPAAAGCKVSEAKVVHESEHEHADHDDHEEHAKTEGDDDHDDHEDHAKGEDHDHEDHADSDHDHDEHGGHSAFHVEYALDCAKPASLATINFGYFKQFAGARSLTVNVVTAKAQNSYEVSRDKPELDLGGMM